jgi:hypothetical protein
VPSALSGSRLIAGIGYRVTRRIDSGTIGSSLSPAQARQVIRSRLRLPLAMIPWMFGVGQAEDIVVGTVVGPRVFARPVPGNWPQGRLLSSILLRGRIRTREDGGCELRWRIVKPVALRITMMLVLAMVGALLLSLYLATGDSAILLIAVLVGAFAIVFAGIRRRFRDLEAGERALLESWLDRLAGELAPEGASAPHAERTPQAWESTASGKALQSLRIDPHAYADLSSELQPGERVLWAGRPDTNRWLAPTDLYAIPISVLWAGWVIFTVLRLLSPPAGSTLFLLGALPFLASALYLLFGRLIARHRIGPRTAYAITNRRALALTPTLRDRRRFTAQPLDHASARVSQRSNRDGHRTVVVGALESDRIGAASGDPGITFLTGPTANIVAFWHITDDPDVHALLSRIIGNPTAPPSARPGD